MTEYLVRKIEPCATCHGQGRITDDPHCARCGDRPTNEQLDAVPYNGAMPCGHLIGYLIEEYPCAECDGQGAIESWVSLDEALSEIGVYSWMTQNAGQEP